jgi:hypothetical protein
VNVLSRVFSLGLAVLLLFSTFALNVGASLDVVESQDKALDKVEPLVLEELAAQGQTDFFVWMTEKADLSPAAALQTKEEKGRFVFETLVETAERTQGALRESLAAQGVDYQAFYIANKILVRGGDQALLASIAARPDVAQITANHQFQLEEPFIDQEAPISTEAVEPNLTFINVDDVWAMGYDGSGTVMAGNDTGLDEDHPAIAPHYRGCLNPPSCTSEDHNYNWWDATGTYPTDPWDGFGHGTHTTGTMVGDDGGTNQIGVAPGAQTIHCKNMTDGGSGSDATFTECFEWDLAPWDLSGNNPDPGMAPDAINNSWGYWGGNQPQFRDEIQALHAAGILVEVSAGNEGDLAGCASLRSPGDYWEVLTTGSINHASPWPGTITGFSSRGPSDLDGDYFPDIMAPGENIRSSVPGGDYEGGWSGTSMAGPHATALVGLMWSACPAFAGRVYDTIDLIISTATPLTGQTGLNCGGDYVDGPNNDWGYGTIDALAAVQAVMAQCTGIGYLDGTVTDGVTGDPVEGAAVTAERLEGGTWQDETDASGYYTRTVPAGTFTVTVEAYGYETGVATGVIVVTDTVTTLDFGLTPTPQYVVSGNVTEEGMGIPLLAKVEALGAPVPFVMTDPATGYYSITLAEGTYTFHVSAELHQPAEREVVVDMDQTQDFSLATLPCLLLVDDDNNEPDVAPYYAAALDALGYDYDVYDVGGSGADGPSYEELAGYRAVIWFSGDKFGGSAGPNDTDEANLAAYLDAGGYLFLSSQDYLYDFGLTTFGQTYLGIGSYSDDTGGATTKYGVSGDPIGDGLGPYPLSYPAGFSDYGDIVNAAAGASVAFRSQAGGGNNLDVDKDGGLWKTAFFGTSWVPVYNNNAANGEEVLERIISWFGACECESPAITELSSDSPVELGQPMHLEVQVNGSSPFAYTWEMAGPGYGSGLDTATPVFTYTEPGIYTPTVTVENACGSDVGELGVEVTCAAPEAAFTSNSPVGIGSPIAFTALVSGTEPFTYTWSFGGPGNGSGLDTPTPVFTYTMYGTFTTVLTVTNPCGMDVSSEAVEVMPRAIYLPIAIKNP